MRLIDADKLHPDRMTNKGTVAISQSQIANAKTVEAVPLSVIEDIRAEIEDIDGITEIGAQILDEVLGIIEQKIKEIKHDNS